MVGIWNLEFKVWDLPKLFLNRKEYDREYIYKKAGNCNSDISGTAAGRCYMYHESVGGAIPGDNAAGGTGDGCIYRCRCTNGGADDGHACGNADQWFAGNGVFAKQ